VYVSGSWRDILRPFQLTIAEKEGLPAEERFNTRNHLVQFALRECASDAGPARQIDEFRCQTDGAEQNWSLGRKLADLSGRIDSILAGHEEVKDDQVWIELPGLADGVFSVGGFATDFPVCVTTQESPETLANDRTVISDQNASRHVISRK
jgi:hypothetical protein